MVLKRVEMAYLGASLKFSENSYASFIKYLSDVDEQASDEFWRTRFVGSSPLQFPQTQNASTDRARNNKMLTHTATISRNTASMGITMPSIIRAAWSMVVAAYSGSNDVVFGETLAGRDIPVHSITEIIGPTFTTVPTRIKVDRTLGVTQFLEEIQRAASEVIPYQHAGLQRIKRLNSETEIACNFQNLLVIQTAEEQIENCLWDLQRSAVASNFFTYPLVLECRSNSDMVEITAHYDDQCLSTWQVQRILFQLGTVLQQLSDIPKIGTNTKLSTVEVFSAQDRELVRGWNSDPPKLVDACIHEEFEEIALSQPHIAAVSAWDGEFTYEELRAQSTALAQHLVTLGVGPEIFVPFCMDKSAWVLVSMLGILMAGGAFVPLDPASPAARHQEMIKEVDARLIICSPQHGHRFNGIVNKVLCIDQGMMTRLSSLPSPQHQPRRATSRNAAYIIFTSGSTGRPKGTVVEHRAIATSSAAMQQTLLMKPSSRVFQFASFTFDASVLETLTVLTYGGCVCIPSEDMRTRNVGEAINSLNATWTFLTPSVANLIDPATVPSLEVLVCGGEAMSIENVQKWSSKVTLINGYGPTETTVIAVANPSVSQQKDPTNIGKALPSGQVWIADPQDHNQIAPVGCVGELLLDGPFIARGYINNETKTDEVFVSRPPWANVFDHTSTQGNIDTHSTRTFASISPSRMYKTGDLVKYSEDGSLVFIGRKDNQVKLHGQRLELGEIEHTLDKDPQVQHALVALPKSGPFRKRLVAVVSLAALASIALSKGGCELVQDGPRAAIARSQVSNARNRLVDILPPYMVPASWLVVESIPLLPSGKLDRRSVDGWLQSIDDATYERILEAEDEDDFLISATETSRLLQQIFSRVLNLPPQTVKLGKSFLSLGGDSITAMQVMALCRKEQISFSLSEVLRCKSIHQLALNARFGNEVQHQEEVLDQDFDLSPIQQLYFQSQTSSVYEGFGRFNQSFSLEITRHVESQDIDMALQRIVGQHSMLRARFSKMTSGFWKQHLIHDVSSSYLYRNHQVENPGHIPSLVAKTQSSLNIRQGPLFAVDLFNLADNRQLIFLAAHHLVIDMVSWRIILGDLEELLNTRTLVAEKPLSFQVWSAMQAEHALKQSSHDNGGVLPFNLPAPNFNYWGIDKRENTYEDVISESFTLDKDLSSLALDRSNNAFRTEPIELFLAAILHSFSRVFVDRSTPAVFNEGHGREPWDTSIDISRTVGWFTTIFPVYVEIEAEEDDVVETVRRMKDIRRSVPDNGRPYFAHQFLTPEGKIDSESRSGPVEIIFNYLGRMQQLEHDDSQLRQWDYPEDEATSKLIADVGPEASRLALFEISAAVVRDRVQFSFLYNSRMHHQQNIKRWITECRDTFEEVVERLADITGESSFTLSDFPLLPISYDGLQTIVTRSLPQVGITQDQVEDIYPCAPLQEGLLMSQLKNPSLYHFHAVFEVRPAVHDGAPVDGQRLSKAWQKVVDHHGALRTVFADIVYKGDIFNQIIVKRVDSGAILVQCEGEESEAIEKLRKFTILEANYTKQPRLPHQATICETSSGKVYFKAEINHAVIDGASANIMLRDLAAAYHERLPDGPGPLYRDYIAYIKSQPAGVGIKFWKRYLEGARACNFPVLTKSSERRLGSVAMKFGRFPELQDMCRKMNVTLANVMQAAWAFCLRRYTKSEDICFGYLTSGRDVPVNGIQSTIGAFINMLVCRVKFTKQSTLKEIFQKVQTDFLQSLEHQHCSLAQVQHDLMAGKALFNTAVSIQSDGPSDGTESTSISFDPVAAHDPSEVYHNPLYIILSFAKP
jgi:amino acid adenylation domain-containing protein/non-ribosomal peptide synthase protein (TIGR01720 family)